MTLDQIKVLDLIVKTGSFRGAAEVLHRAQSAVSYSIKTLEEDLGISLFDRDSYRPKLTPEGRAIHNKARAILAQTEEFEVLGKQLALGNEAVLDIAVSSVAPITGLIELLKEFTKVFPDTQINLFHEQLRLPFERVQDESAAFAISPSFEGIEGMERCSWGVVRMIPVAAPDFSARNLGRALSWGEMLHYTQIVVMDPPSVKLEVNANVVEGAKRWRVSDFSAMKDLVQAGIGWAYMPEHWVGSDIKRGKLAVLKLDRGGDEIYLNLLRKTSRPLGPAGQFVWELLRKAAVKA